MTVKTAIGQWFEELDKLTAGLPIHEAGGGVKFFPYINSQGEYTSDMVCFVAVRFSPLKDRPEVIAAKIREVTK